MLLTLEQMKFLNRVTDYVDGCLIAKPDLSRAERKELLEIDILNFVCKGKHFVKNYDDLK